jgi:hypothetical protein
MDIDVNLTHTLVSYIAYWQHLDIACFSTTPYEWCCQLEYLVKTIEVKVVVIVIKLLPSYFTYAKILAFNPYVGNTSFTCITMVALDVSIVSNNPIVI